MGAVAEERARRDPEAGEERDLDQEWGEMIEEHRLAIFLALGMTASVYLITDLLFGEPATAVVTTLLGAAFVSLWYVCHSSGACAGGIRQLRADGPASTSASRGRSPGGAAAYANGCRKTSRALWG
jgi:hypothetical protein